MANIAGWTSIVHIPVANGETAPAIKITFGKNDEKKVEYLLPKEQIEEFNKKCHEHIGREMSLYANAHPESSYWEHNRH